MARRKTNGKRRRSVRCQLCTTYRWMGNNKGRFKHRDEQEMHDQKRLQEVGIKDTKQI